MLLKNIIPFAHCLLRQALPEGGNALDGTAGNGHDTLFLAQTAGIRGKVWAFDIQPQALNNTRCRLQEAGYSNVRLILDGHENLKQYVSEPLNAAIFNFGWLPGGDKSLTTRTETSITALSAALSLAVCLLPSSIRDTKTANRRQKQSNNGQKTCLKNSLPFCVTGLPTGKTTLPICWHLKSYVKNKCLR